MEPKKKIRELTAAERQAYNKERYQARQRTSLTITIANCTPELEAAILSAIADSKESK